jgi:ubiquinol-cytochrome c reductase cytochrome c1 subunit
MKKFLSTFLFASLIGFGVGHVMADSELRLERAPIDVRNTSSLQAGARTFVDYCQGCHSASLMRYNRLADLGFSEQQIKDDLMFLADKKIGEMMDISMAKADAKSWFGGAPPDLSVIARSRGADWLYAFLRSFYRDPLSATGWNNLAFEHVGMPHALWQLQGEPALEAREFKTKAEAEAAQIQTKSFSVVAEREGETGGKEATRYVLQSINVEKPGTISQAKYDETVRDLVNFLVWLSEPTQVFRRQIGFAVVFFFFLLTLLTWFVYKEFWKDVH